MAQHIKNTACPKCREQGNDRAGDNLALYSDDSSYCWNCGYWSAGSLSARQFLARNARSIPKKLPRIILPEDSTLDYPSKALHWIEQYELTRSDLLNNQVVYSESQERLIFPFWAGEDLLGWQGRYFGNDPDKIKKNKWFSHGNLQDIFHIFFLGKVVVGHALIKSGTLILVEDIISAIKVSKLGISCMSLFGVNVKNRISRIRVLGYLEAILFLDPDMHLRMIKECNTARLNGFKMHPLLGDRDPKEYSLEELKELLK